ncbi:geranyl transferase [Virgibacillus indicus]|uniref:Geranyl transferase n=1 Tax=Virgibacillus indicus TaxID=2024554 RepID=A0A265N925_9BACI|nr:polyprenyl synthetase family protein [Virgibacillus indicus]OZU87959.1 geranyl transferase [Virgibacillus indicus]
MNENLIINADTCYRQAELRADAYFRTLSAELMEKTFVHTLTKDIQSWKQNHIHYHSFPAFLSRKKKKTGKHDYHNYIQWLNYTGKLGNYLNRSISYIYMRDLGKDLNDPHTQTRVQKVVDSLKDYLTHSKTTNQSNKLEPFSMAGLYRLAQKENIESTMIWLVNKLKIVSSNIPEEIDADEAKRKLIKIIAGVLMHENEEMDGNISPEERSRKLDEAIRLGYSYGLTYPFIDDLLDSSVLSSHEKKQYSNLIRTALTTGSVPELNEGVWDNQELIRFIHSELREAFEYIKTHQQQEKIESFFEQSYVFFHSQEVDREKDLSNPAYTNEELFIPIILKSASSRLIVRSVISAAPDKGFGDRTFYYGIYNQLADDFTDMFDDLKQGAVTPYTYYMKYHDKRSDLINPFELYWTVISHLIHNVYQSDKKTREVILNRAINSLKRFKKRMGNQGYDEVMKLFASGNPKFNRIIQKMVEKADDVDFFDKLLRDHIISTLKEEGKEKEEFSQTVETVRSQVNNSLPISKSDDSYLLNEPIIDAANYSLIGNGKRLRPIITWMMGVHAYGLEGSAIMPLLKSLEYMHTASLVFDDLPSQDNANVRRGRPTLHQEYNVAVAELTGLFLTQKATTEQASLKEFDSEKILRLIHFSSQMTADMCKGQAMDLNSRGKDLTFEQLNRLSYYKTGIGFEASLIMPAILAGETESEIAVLKKFARHAGIAFQIKDDLLDVEGESDLLGKTTNKDIENNQSTFVSVLGVEGAKKAMWEHYCLAMEVLQELTVSSPFLKHLLNYIINRDY